MCNKVVQESMYFCIQPASGGRIYLHCLWVLLYIILFLFKLFFTKLLTLWEMIVTPTPAPCVQVKETKQYNMTL